MTDKVPARRGRPKGSLNKSTLKKKDLEEAAHARILEVAADVVGALYAKAMDGDTAAAKALLDKIVPNAQKEQAGNSTPQININIGEAAGLKPIEINTEAEEQDNGEEEST